MGRRALKLETLEVNKTVQIVSEEIHEMSVTMKRIKDAVDEIVASNTACWPKNLEELVRILLSGRTTTEASERSIQFAIEKRKELLDLGAKLPLLLQVVNKVVAEDGHYSFQKEIICERLRQTTHDRALAVLEKMNATPDVDPIITEIFKTALTRRYEPESAADHGSQNDNSERISHTAIKKRRGNKLGHGRGRKKGRSI